MKFHPPVLNRKPRASRTGLLCTALLAATAFTAHAQNTGFGTTTPASKVTVKGNFAVGAGAYTTTPAPANGAIIQGFTGIGTTDPIAPLHIATIVPAGDVWLDGTQVSNFRAYGYREASETTYYNPAAPAYNLSVYAEGGIASSTVMYANYFQAVYSVYINSDSRLKDVVGVSDASNDLATLNRIAITDYTMKDKFVVGDRKFKKVIAQDVEKVFPEAINKTVGALPDIMQAGDVAANGDVLTVTLAKATDLKAGERVEFRNQKNTPETAIIESVDKNVLTVSLKQVRAGEKVFVYGRKVNDLRTVDYDAISMLNVSATQELSRKLDAQQTKITALETENSELRKIALEMKELKALVAALEGKANGTVTVSLTK